MTPTVRNITYQEGDDKKSVSPDLMVVFGAPKYVRSSYRLWEEPKVPAFVLEVASESTYRSDRGEKRDICADMGVMEYWQCDQRGVISIRRCWASGLSRGVMHRSP